MRVTIEFLREHNACKDEVAIFETEWPDGAELTLENLLRAVGLGLDIYWLAPRVLLVAGHGIYGHRWRRYCSAIELACEKYQCDTRCALERYDNRDAGMATTKAYAALQKAIAPHKAVLDTAVAYALIEALEGD